MKNKVLNHTNLTKELQYYHIMTRKSLVPTSYYWFKQKLLFPVPFRLIPSSLAEVTPVMKSSGMKQVTDPVYWYSNDNWMLRTRKKQICDRSTSKSRRAALMLPTCILHWIYSLFLLWPSFPGGTFMIWDGHHSKEMFQRDVLCYSRATGEGQDEFYTDVMTVSCKRYVGLWLGFDF